MYSGAGSLSEEVHLASQLLRSNGSRAVPGFTNPEGMVVYMHGSDQNFKVIFDKQGPSPIEGQ
jgi:hypothetical protein